MTGIKRLEKIIEELKATQQCLANRLKELEAANRPATGRWPGELPPEDLAYIRRHRPEEYDSARKESMRISRMRLKATHNDPLGNHKGLPLQRGGEKQREAA